jgi:hypothetical protein
MVKEEEPRGPEVFREPRLEMRAKFGFAGSRDEIGVQTLRRGRDSSVPDARMLAEDRFDFGGFNANSSNLQLIIDAAYKFELAIGKLADAVAGAVSAAERGFDESAGGEFGELPITSGESGAEDE